MLPMRRFRLLLAICISFGCMTACGSGGTGSGTLAGRRPTLPTSGSVAGLLARDGSGVLTLVYNALPAGFTPAGGIPVAIASGPSGVTDADGSFLLNTVTVGSQKLEIKPAGGAAIEIPLTVFPNSSLRVGQPPISRTDAVNAAKTWLAGQVSVDGLAIIAPQQPLPAGAVIGTAFQPDPGATVHTLAAPEWLVYIDRFPNARFGHAVDYLFIDAQSGALTAVTADAWPLVNGRGYYEFSGEKVLPDRVQAGSGRSAQTSIRSSATGLKPATATRSGATSRDHVLDPHQLARTYSLALVGGEPNPVEAHNPAFRADAERIGQFLHNSAFPQAAETVVFDSWADTVDGYWPDRYKEYPYGSPADFPRDQDFVAFAHTALGIIQSKMDALFAKMQSRDVFLLYISAHGTHRFTGHYQFYIPIHYYYKTRGHDEFGTDYFYDGGGLVPISITALDFTKCKACHIAIIADTCESYWMVDDMMPVFQNSTGKEVILVGASKKKSFDVREATKTFDLGDLGSVTLPLGGIMSSVLIKSLSSDDSVGGFYGALTAAVNQATPVTSRVYDLEEFPRVWTRTLAPDEVCGGGSSTLTIRSAGAKK